MMAIDADEIIPNLWQGSFPPQGRALAEAGFNVVVLCARELQLPTGFLDIRVISAPNDDNPSVPINRADLETAFTAARQVAAAIQDSQRCLVTCAAGMNRSGLVSALTLHMLFGWSGAQCMQRVVARRKSSPLYAPLSNPQFRAILERLHRVETPLAYSLRG